MNPAAELLFVYGTLMTGEENEAHMRGQRLLGAAETGPGWTLYLLDGYPGAVRLPGGPPLAGELWAVDPDALARLDEFEGVGEGLYRREREWVRCGERDHQAWIYVYPGETEGRRAIGADWRRRTG
ncbi:MAG: gamma-glutamylcyclotransferase family protein [Opitutaceae bacterium]|nr:gamma-glutamylcyclotransferase family protein [Opitutaceae bacterium]